MKKVFFAVLIVFMLATAATAEEKKPADAKAAKVTKEPLPAEQKPAANPAEAAPAKAQEAKPVSGDDLVPPWELKPEELATWDDYAEKYSLYCMAPFGAKIKKPLEVEIAGKTFVFEGSSARIESKEKPQREIKFGVLSGVKDWHPDTQENLKFFIAQWQKEKVEGIILGGDIAYEEEDLSNIMALFADTKLPVYVVVGNNDSRSEFNRVIRKLSKAHKNIINMDLIRVLHGDGFDMISLPGYYDKKFTRGSASCTYKPKDTDDLLKECENIKDPAILVTHGPMKFEGKDGIDNAFEAGNVGDENLTKAVTESKAIRFGIMGHILEAGGRANTLDGKLVKPGVWSGTLFINPGPAQALGWRMQDGKTSFGMAATLTIKGKQGKYHLLVPPPKKNQE